MNFEHSDKVKDLLARVSKFMDDNIYPAEAVYAEQMQAFSCLLYTSDAADDP